MVPEIMKLKNTSFFFQGHKLSKNMQFGVVAGIYMAKK